MLLDRDTFDLWCPHHADSDNNNNSGADDDDDDDYSAYQAAPRPRRQPGT